MGRSRVQLVGETRLMISNLGSPLGKVIAVNCLLES